MHRTNLYNVCPTKTKCMSELVASIISLAGLQGVGDRELEVAALCTAFVTSSALEWKEEGFLVQRGLNLGKCNELKGAWATHRIQFESSEAVVLAALFKNCLNEGADTAEMKGNAKRVSWSHTS